jgi:periodic tryptophan protein 1
MITATTWVPRGFAAPFPTKYTFDEEEFKRIAELAKLQLDDANEDLDEARNGARAANASSDGEGSDAKDIERPLKSTAWVFPNNLFCNISDKPLQ